MVEHAKPVEQIIPVVDHVVAVAHRQQRQFLRPRVRHIHRYRQKLLEKEKYAKGRALHLPVQNEIGSQHQRNAQLQQRAARHGNELPEKAEQQVPTLVNRNEHQVHELRKAGSASQLKQKDRVERSRNVEHKARHRLPLFFESQKKRQAFGPRLRKIHSSLSHPATTEAVNPRERSMLATAGEGKVSDEANRVRGQQRIASARSTGGVAERLDRLERLLLAAEVLVNGLRGAAAFGNRPHNQRLAAAHVPRRKDAGNRTHVIPLS